MRPAGYKDGEQQGEKPFVVTEAGPNIINVVYPTVAITVTVKGKTGTFPYNGASQEVNGYEFVSAVDEDEHAVTGFSADNITLVDGAQAKAARTDVGTTQMGLSSASFKAINTAYNDVTFEVTDGSITITANNDVVVTITGFYNTAAYDGEEHKVEGYTVSTSDPNYTEDDFDFEGNKIAKRTAVGTTNMGLTAANFTNKNANYGIVTFNVTDGYQTIEAIDVTVTITGHNGEAVYDGQEHKVEGYEVEISNPLYTAADFTFSGTAVAARTEAGTTDMGLAPEKFTNTNSNFATVTFNVTDGYMTITPAGAVTVTITGHNNTTDYDGAEHSVSGYDVQTSNPLYTEANFTFDGNKDAARTDAGTTNMGLAASQFINNSDNFESVTFNVTDGYQTINPINVTVTITGHSNTAEYDGAEHSVEGYGVQISNSLYKESDFTFKGTAEAARTDEGTTNMGLTADDFVNTNSNFGTVTFNVTDGYQTITPVNTVTVTITGHSNTTDYDGAEHSVSGYDVQFSNPLYTEADFTFSGNKEAARTDVGTTNMGLAADQFTNTSSNFTTVVFNVTDGYQTISPINVTVTITGHNNTTDYDGAEHSVEGYEVQISNPLYTKEDFTFSGNKIAARTDVGTTNMGLSADKFTNTNTNFGTVTFNVTDGYQTIEAIDVTVTIEGHKGSAVYDGEEHSVSGYDVQIDNPLYTVADFTFSGTAVAARTDAGTTNMGLAASKFTNTNTNFGTVTFNVTDGEMVITPLEDVTVTITGHSNSSFYDGVEHKVEGYDVEISNPLYTKADFIFSGTAEAALTEVGTKNMGLAASQFTNTNNNFKNVTFSINDGYQNIKVVPVTVTIIGNNNTTDYDGQEHSVSGYTATSNVGIYDVNSFISFTGTDSAARKEAGTTNMGLKAGDFSNTNDNFFPVTFNVTDGYQTINPIDVTVTITGKNTKVDYDGEVHTVTGYDVETSTSLYTAADIDFSGTATAVRTDAGTTQMGLAEDQFSNKNESFASVTFNVTDGYVTIDPINVTVTITGKNTATDYDGAEHSVNGYGVEISNPLYTEADFTFSGTAAAARTDAGTTQMGLAASQFTNTNDNFATVTFNVTDGYVTINPIDVTVTITGQNNTTSYDGAEHKVEGYGVEISNPLYTEADFTFSGTAAVARTDAGTTQMGLAASQFTNTNDNFATVTFNVTDGYQTINPIDVTVTIAGNIVTATYDAAEHKAEGYTVEISNPLYTEADFTFSGTAVAARTDVGTTNMGLAAEQFANTNDNFATVTFNVTDGYVAIAGPDEVIVTITGKNNTTNFDGAEHKVEGYDVLISNPLYKEADFTFSGTAAAARTDAGTTQMGLAASQFTNTNANFETVTFNVTDGYQTINPIDVTVTVIGHTDTKEYDGNEYTVEGYEISADNPLYLINEFLTFNGTAVAKRTDAGKTEMGIKADQFVNSGENFGTVTVNVTDGYQEITPKAVEITVVGHSATVEYNGKEQSVTGYDMTIPAGISITKNDVKFVGSASASGSAVGSYKMGLNKDQFSVSDPNYNVTFVVTDGVLTITAASGIYAITITADSDEKVYTGETFSGYGYTVSAGSSEGQREVATFTEDSYVAASGGDKVTVNGATFTVSGIAVNTSAREVGEYDIEILGDPIVRDSSGNIVTDMFTITKNTGKLIITPMAITVTSASASKVYDGKALTNDEITEEPGWGIGDVVSYEVTGSQTVVGSSKNTFEIIASEDVLRNYTITKVEGELTVTAASEPAPTPTPTPDNPTPEPTPGPTPGPGPAPEPTPIDDTPVPMAATPVATPAEEVLGARREATGAAVLGARRGRTDDETNNTARAFAIIVAAAAALSLIIRGKMKEEEEEEN